MNGGKRMKPPSGYFRFVALLIVGAIIVYSGGTQLSANFDVAEQKIEERPKEYQQNIDDIIAQQKASEAAKVSDDGTPVATETQKVIVPQRPPSLNTYQPPRNTAPQYTTIVTTGNKQEPTNNNSNTNTKPSEPVKPSTGETKPGGNSGQGSADNGTKPEENTGSNSGSESTPSVPSEGQGGESAQPTPPAPAPQPSPAPESGGAEIK